MLGTFLDKLNTLFDRRLVIAYWSPIFVVAGMAGALMAVVAGPSAALSWWVKRGATPQLLLGFGALLSITVLAYILEALTTPIVRFFEGYWTQGKLYRWACTKQTARREKLSDSARYQCYPVKSSLIKPTRLGNVLVAAEEYPYQLYRLDAVLWWPRLAALLPETIRTQIDTALTPMLAMLNLSMMLMLFMAGTVATLVAVHHWWWQLGCVLIAEILLARVCYLAATIQAEDYGATVRVAFDLYRYDLLKQMHIPLPDNLFKERLLWELLNRWAFSYAPPWQIGPISDAKQPDDPFFNDTHAAPVKSASPQEVVVTLRRDTQHPAN